MAVVAGLLRLVPHPWNLTPVGALGIFAGARLRSWHAFALPLLVMAVTNAILSAVYGYPFLYLTLPFVLASFLVNVLLGRLLRRSESPFPIAAVSLLASVQFFLVTNFGVWLVTVFWPAPDMVPYTPDLPGLLACYAAGIPFFGGTVAGDLIYCGLLFGLHSWLTRTRFAAERVSASPSF
jgi:hypothetical protein